MKNADICCICETHLGGESGIIIDGYEWYGHNRQVKHKYAPKMSGGVGILVKHCISCYYHVNIIDKSVDGVLGISFVGKYTDISICIFVCYLPPESSVWGRDALSFFAHLVSQIYAGGHYDHVFMCGDFNARLETAKIILMEWIW